jgi:hypothetical protein
MTSVTTNAQHGSLAVVADPYVYATLDAIGLVGSKHAILTVGPTKQIDCYT